jgi:hypothetical protein
MYVHTRCLEEGAPDPPPEPPARRLAALLRLC